MLLRKPRCFAAKPLVEVRAVPAARLLAGPRRPVLRREAWAGVRSLRAALTTVCALLL